MIEVPIGTVVAFAGEIVDTDKAVFIEQNWLLCNGAALSSNDRKFNALFQHIKTAHGNASNDTDPATDFNLPDYRGLFLRGVAHARIDRDKNTDDRTTPFPLERNGGNSGNKVGSYQPDATKKPNKDFITNRENNHTHSDPTWNGRPGNFELATEYRGRGGVDFGAESAQTSASGGHSHNVESGGDDETRPKNSYVNYIIRAM